MWAGATIEADADQVGFEEASHAPRREPGPIAVEEDGRFVAARRLSQRAPSTDPGHGHPPDRAEPLAATFAADSDQFLLGIEVVEVEPDELAHPEAAAVERLEHRPVA